MDDSCKSSGVEDEGIGNNYRRGIVGLDRGVHLTSEIIGKSGTHPLAWPQGVRRIDPGKHKRRNNLVNLC